MDGFDDEVICSKLCDVNLNPRLYLILPFYFHDEEYFYFCFISPTLVLLLSVLFVSSIKYCGVKVAAHAQTTSALGRSKDHPCAPSTPFSMDVTSRISRARIRPSHWSHHPIAEWGAYQTPPL